ncbi:alpha/beta hydrolase [Janthinobacterium fluminis]|uniref:Alpha/beta fold hydrolase n=1 Tax=Janthinobacterium fluminis TaxID=2987524 RepID=A0ABT5JTQ1_9BURK|nr:alpha/beta fold hydrolase [Janthinobacterium fluminis]MDC8756125.1 alpha/beta fold hydrolase [Janthinobacterium fluminis]
MLRTILFAVLLGIFTHAEAAPSADAAIALSTPTGQLHGALLLPAASGPVPAVLIVAGSGPTDRNGNNTLAPGANNSLMLLAQALSQAGFATLRYDKRGVAASAAAGPSEAALRFDTYVDDAAAWLRLLRADPRFSSVAVIGHSEGSLIGMLAARQTKAAAFVSIAGPAQGAADVLRQQLAPQLPAELAGDNERILRALERGETDNAVPAPLAALYRPSVQPYMISWFKYVPTRELSTLAAPALIVQGDTDIQVGVAQAQALQQASPAATLLVVPGMNHVLKTVPAQMPQQLASYSDPALPLAPGLSPAIAAFLHQHAK